MRNKKKFVTYLILTILTMLTIFLLSAQDGSSSSTTSFRFANTLIGKFAIYMAKVLLPMFDPIDVVRETAHAFEFFVLSLFSYGTLYNYKDIKYTLLINIIFGVLYAISDEIHQIFVPYRTCQLFDIMMDSLGIILGSLICYIVIEIKKKNK